MKILQNQSSSNLPCTQNVGMKPIFPCKDKWYYPLWKSCLRFSNNIIKYPTEMFPTRKKHIHILLLSLSIVLSKKIDRYIQEISMHACIYILQLCISYMVPVQWQHVVLHLLIQQQPMLLTLLWAHKGSGSPSLLLPFLFHKQ